MAKQDTARNKTDVDVLDIALEHYKKGTEYLKLLFKKSFQK